MALDFLGHGLSITSETSPLAPTVIQGGDLLNLTFHFDYNGTNDVLLENSTACQQLSNRTVFINFVITLPIVLEIIYPTNMRNHNGSILTDFTNCSVSPLLEVNSSVFRSDNQGFNIIKFDILSQNVSWAVSLDVRLRLLHSAKSGSLLNITANVVIASETQQFNIPSYRTPIPGNLQLALTSTSFPETPNVTLTSEEEFTLSATFHLPKITADLTLVITLHPFGDSTPMRYLRGSVRSLSPGVKSQKLDINIPPEFSISASNLHRFPHPNVAKFVFGDTVNTASEPSDGIITVEVTGMVDSMHGVYAADSKGNVTCILMYYSSRGYNIVANETFFTLKLGQPLLERDFMIQGSECCYEGNDIVELDFEVKNPDISTAPAFNVAIDIVVSSSDIAVHNIMVMFCQNHQASNVINCTDLMGTDMMTNSSSGLTVSLPRLNSSSWVKGSLLTFVKPSVSAKSFHSNQLTLVYTRPDWLPIHVNERQSIMIKSIIVPLGPSVISSDVPHPSRDFMVITIGEDMAFRITLAVPVSTFNDDFTVAVFGPGVEGVTGRISRVGSNIQALHGNISGAAFNITPSSKISRNFGTVINTGSSLLPSDSEIEYEATVRLSNSGMVTNGKSLDVQFGVTVNGIGQPDYTQSLEVIEPDLSVNVTVSRSSEVQPDYDLTYNVQLHHSKKSTSHAFRVLLEIAVPHEHLWKAEIMASPAGGSLTIVDGNQAPSGNPRYNNPSTKVLLYQADDLLLGQTVAFKYKATTISNLLSSVFVSSPVHLAYVTLPKSLAPREGRKYSQNLDQAIFLTFRPSPFISVAFEPVPGSFDAGDRVQYNLTLKNIAQTTTAHDVSILTSFEALDVNRFSVNCNSTSSPATFNATSRESKLVVSSIAPSQTVSCNYESYLEDRLSPKQLISRTVAVEYYSLAAGSRPAMVASYKDKKHAFLTTKAINTTIMASQNAEELQAGDPVNFTLRLQLPDCVTNLTVGIYLPTVPRSVIDLSRRRRDVRGLYEGSSSEEAGRRSRVRRNAGVVYVLAPLLNESYSKYGNGFTLSQLPIITQANAASLNVSFGLIENLPGSGPNDTIEIFLKFKTANEPLILSGRPLRLAAVLKFDAGSDNSTKTFKIVGPLLKPLLSINKTVKVLQNEGDSPPVAFNVTVSHASGSPYDARDLIVTDTVQGMDIYDSDISTKGVFISYPRKNTIGVRFLLPGLRISETRSFIYVAHFRVQEKEPSTQHIPAEVSWKSVQLNSLTYRLQSDATRACLQRNDVDKPEPRKVYGFFALGVLLGLLIGAVIAAIVVFVVLKCCDKGKMAPYYMRFTNTTTMTVLTGGSPYIYNEEELPNNNPIEKHSETSIVQTDESIVPILSLDNATQTEKELNSLDVQSTAALDADLETQQQNMFIKAVKLLARKLRVKREISFEQESNFCLEIKQAIGEVAFKMAAEYRQKSAELRKALQKEGKNHLDALHGKQRNEREETENKIKGLVNEREKKNILELLKKRHEAQKQELKQNLKLEQDVEMEKLRKEVSISKRFALKETQNKMIQNLIKDAELNEEQANAIIKDHLANMAAIDKATDKDRARRVMALEMRLAERRALARQKQEEEERKQQDLKKLEENHSDALENLVRSSTLSSEDAAVYLERYRKEMEVVNSKLAKDRKRQEQRLHQKLTALKQKKIEKKAREHQRQIKEFEEKRDKKFEQVQIDTVTAINEKQKILEQQRQEIEEIERNSDREAAEEVENLRDQQTREANQLIKNNAQKMYQELVNKGLSESEKEAMLERHMADLAMQQEVREEERRRQTQLLERRLEKQRAVLEKKMKEEQAEQAEIRKQEDKIVGDLIVNQVVMSEEERDRIIQEHEKNLAELESSLTLSKLRQRQLLEEKLAKRRKRRMEKLEKRQMDETKDRDRDYDDKIMAEGEDIEMIKKHEQEKMEAMKEDEIHIEDEMEMVREEMLAERFKKLEEHNEKLGAIIAKLQIEKAKQMSKIAMQQEALGQLQAGLVGELESQGTFQDPETQKIMEKYHKDTKNLEENLKVQKDKQEKALRDRLQGRMRQREETLVLQQKDELSRYMKTQNASNMAMKLRKAAVKAKQQNQLNELRSRMQKEIDQSINELKMASDIRRMQAIEAQNIKLISILVQQGKLQEEELEGVLNYLFPTKSLDEIDELLSKIFGPNHNNGSSGHTSLDPRRPSTLEDRIRRHSTVHNTSPPTIRKKKKKSKKNKEEEPKDLPPINFKGGIKKGFSLNESLRGYRSLADEEQDSSRSEPRGDDGQRGLPNVSRNGSYRPLTEDNSQGLVDEMFGDSPEESRKTSGKKRRNRRIRDDEDVVS